MTPIRGPPLAWLVALLFFATALAGCHGLGATTSEYGPVDDPGVEKRLPTGPIDEDREETVEENETPDPPELELALSLPEGRSFTGRVLNVSIHVTGDNVSADWLGLSWSRESTKAFSENELGVDLFDGKVAASGDGHALPGNYSVDWKLVDAGVHYLRAKVVANDTLYWSAEANVTVLLPVEEGDFEADHTVNLRTNLLGPCEGDGYNPESLEIEAGEVVQWVNAASCPHTATHDAKEPLWDTGLIEANEESTYGYRFNEPGTYEVHCTQHSGMSATIIVA